MSYLLQCNRCGARVWSPGSEDSDTNSFEVDPPEPTKWDEHEPRSEETLGHSPDCCCGMRDCPGTFTKFSGCDHEDYEVIDEDHSRLADDVI